MWSAWSAIAHIHTQMNEHKFVRCLIRRHDIKAKIRTAVFVALTPVRTSSCFYTSLFKVAWVVWVRTCTAGVACAPFLRYFVWTRHPSSHVSCLVCAYCEDVHVSGRCSTNYIHHAWLFTLKLLINDMLNLNHSPNHISYPQYQRMKNYTSSTHTHFVW